MKATFKPYSTLTGANRFMLLLGPEPWKALKKNPDDFWCCAGAGCTCGGITVRDEMLGKRKDMPKLEYVRLEQRQVGEWEKITESQKAVC